MGARKGFTAAETMTSFSSCPFKHPLFNDPIWNLMDWFVPEGLCRLALLNGIVGTYCGVSLSVLAPFRLLQQNTRDCVTYKQEKFIGLLVPEARSVRGLWTCWGRQAVSLQGRKQTGKSNSSRARQHWLHYYNQPSPEIRTCSCIQGHEYVHAGVILKALLPNTVSSRTKFPTHELWETHSNHSTSPHLLISSLLYLLCPLLRTIMAPGLDHSHPLGLPSGGTVTEAEHY